MKMSQLKTDYNTPVRFTGLLFLFVFFGFAFSGTIQAQSLPDGFFKGAGNFDATFSTTYEVADQFYVGDTKTDLAPFYQEITRKTLSLHLAYGLTNNLDVSLNLPYIITDGDGQGPRNQIPPQNFNNIQDGSLTLKWRPVRAYSGPGIFNLVASGAISVPLSDYENSEFGDPQSQRPILVALGDRASRVTGSLLAQYRFFSGLFTSIQGGYSLSGETGVDNLDVPNAALVSGKLGYLSNSFYGAAWISSKFSSDGTNIGEGRFPTNQVDYTKLGITGSYSIIESLSINASYSTTIEGRNALDANGISVGITYKFGR